MLFALSFHSISLSRKIGVTFVKKCYSMIEKRGNSSLSSEYDTIHVDKPLTQWMKFIVRKRGTLHYAEENWNIKISIALERL